MYPSSSVSLVRILIIDDDEDDFALTRDLISGIRGGEFQIDWCRDYNEGSTAIFNSIYNIYFIDYYLGAKTGIDLLREAIQRDCKDPIILLTGQGNPKVDIEAMRSGAADYLIKSELTSEKLERCIRYALERATNLEQSRSNERKFRKIFDRSKDVIFISNQDLRLYDVNIAATELFGYETEELLQVSLFDLMYSVVEKDELFEMLSTNKEIIDFSVSFHTSNKSIKNCLLSTSMEIDSTGSVYVQGMIRDISLANKIEEIKIQSKKLEEKGLVIRTLAHEIRNPLHNITLSLGLLKNSATETNREFLNVIERNSKRINDLINELMDSNQYYKMKLKVVSLQTVLKETLEKAADRIALSKIKLNFDYSEKEATVLADREKLKIAFLNVIINAIEATTTKEEGEISISIVSDSNIHKVLIQDNGCGMSNEATKSLFEPYFTMKPKGMGLGLAATFAIMQSHKAEIEVSSVLQKGTCFQFSFQAF